MKTPEQHYTSAVKEQVGREAHKNRKTIGDLALEYKLPAYTILKWKNEFLYDLHQEKNDLPGSEKDENVMEKLNSKISQLEKEKSLYAQHWEKPDFWNPSAYLNN